MTGVQTCALPIWAVFTGTAPGEYSITLIQCSDGLALMLRSVVNSFFETYMSQPDGIQKLRNTLTTPLDGKQRKEQILFTNPLWDLLED